MSVLCYVMLHAVPGLCHVLHLRYVWVLLYYSITLILVLNLDYIVLCLGYVWGYVICYVILH